MKKILLLMVAAALAIVGCSQKQKSISDMTPMEKEVYVDSLVNVASGIDGVTLRENRKNALEILRKEYSNLENRWKRMEECINNMELYSE